MRWFGIMLMAALLASAPGYASAQPAGKKEPSPATQPQGSAVKAEPAGMAKTYTPEERKAYEKKTAAELEAIEQRIDELVGKGYAAKEAHVYQEYEGPCGADHGRTEPVNRLGKSPRKCLGRFKGRYG